MTPRPRLVTVLTTLVALTQGCATTGTISAGSAPSSHSEFSSKNEEELLAIGMAAAQAGDDPLAAEAYGFLADTHPRSPHVGTALLGAGLALRKLGQFDRALERYQRLRDDPGDPRAIQAAFGAVECLYHLGERAEARADLGRLAKRTDLQPPDRLRALTELGVLELEGGDLDAAERSLGAALAGWKEAGRNERLPERATSKSHFHLGEVHRMRMLQTKLDPTAGDVEALTDLLERKAQLLLSAQAEYFAAMRTGDPEFGIASASRIGELYEDFHREIMTAPMPQGFDEEMVAAYREELDALVRVLVEKAILAYEETLSAARRVDADHAFVPQAEEGLARMRRMLDRDP